jgi:chromosome segregation ATPase
LDTDLDEAIQSNEKANAYIEQLSELLDEAWRANKECDTDIQMLNDHIKVLNKRLTKYNNEAKGYEISLNALDAEHRKTIQHLYGRIGAMQRQLNRLKSLP